MTSESRSAPHSGSSSLESPPHLAATETTPLLNGTLPKPVADGADGDGQDVSDTDSDAGSIAVVAHEISELRLILTLTTTWVGVFLGAIDAVR